MAIDNVTVSPGYSEANANIPTVDGSLGTSEYGPSNSYKFTGGGNSFSSPLGGGSVYLKSDGSNLYAAYQLGGTLNDSVVLLIDTGSSNPATYPNITTGGDERAVSRMFNNSAVLPAGFRASYAVVFAGANQSAGNRFYTITTTAVSSTSLGAQAGTGTASGNVREVRIPYSTLGISSGATVRVLAGLSNPSGTPAFLANESVPANPLFNAAVQTGTSGGTFTNFGSFATISCPTITTSLTVSAATSTICAGSNASITVANSQVGVSYQLRTGTTNIGAPVAGTGGTITLTDAPTSTTTYNVLATSCATSTQLTQTATVAVNAVPGTPTSPGSSPNSYCSNAVPSSVTLSATLNGGTSIQWFTGSCGGTAVTPISSTATSVTIAAPTSTTTYFARATDGTCTSAACAQVTVTVNPATVIGTQPGNQSACVGGTVNFSVAATGTGLSYQWKKGSTPLSNGGAISGATSNTLTITGVAAGDAGTYSVDVLSSSCSTVTSNSATLTVINPPSAGLSVSPASASVCSGTGTNIVVAASEAGVSYQLRNNAGNTNVGSAVTGTGGSINLPTGNLSATTTFNVNATAAGCTAVQLSQTATVSVNALPNAPTGSTSYSAIAGSSLTISATPGAGETIDWFTGSCGGTQVATASNTLNIASVAQGSTTYYARARNTTTGCSGTNCLVVTVSGGAQVVISQVYGAGGNTNSIYRNDFVELFNRGSTAVDLSGWTVQYASASGTFSNSAALSGSIQPYSYFLVSLASGGANGALLPTADASNTNVNMSSTDGKVALANNSTPVTGPSASNVVDFLGYGSANQAEGTAAAAITTTTATFRILNGCTDTNNNQTDFSTSPTATPRPRNSASPRNVCGGGVSETLVDSGNATGSVDGALSSNEYGTGNVNKYGGDGSGFAGMLGYWANTAADSARVTKPRVYVKSDVTGINFGLQLGADLGTNNENNTVVLLLNVRSGGVSGGTSIPFDSGDSIQVAIARAIASGLPAGFDVDYAVGFNRFGVYSWSVSGSGLTFIGSGAGGGLAASQFREIRLTYAQMNNFAPGGNIDYLLTLNNGIPPSSGGTGMSDETIPVSPAFSGSGNPGNSGGNITNFNRVVTVPCTNVAISQSPQSATVCDGANASFTVTASGTSLSYQWRRNGSNLTNGGSISGATSATLSITGVSAANAGTYDVVVSNACPSSATSSGATLTVNEVTTITGQPGGQSVCAGSTATFTVVAGGTGLSYQWRKDGNTLSNGGNISGAQSAMLTISNASAADVGSYDVVVSGTCGNATSNSVPLSVQPAPSGSASYGGSTIYTSETISLTGSVANTTGYSWSVSGGSGTFGTPSGSGPSASTTFTLSSGVIGQQVTLTLSAAAVSPCVGSSVVGTVVLDIVAQPCVAATVANFSVSPSATVCPGTAVTFSASGAGTAPFTYTFRKGSSIVQSGAGSSYSISSPVAGDSGSYTVEVSNACGNQTSSPIALVVNQTTSIVTSPSDADVCTGAPATFSVSANGANLTYQWRKNNSNIIGANAPTYSITSAASGDAGSYDCVVTGTCGSATSSAASLTVQPLTQISGQPSSNASQCEGTSTSFGVVATGSSLVYAWEQSVDSGTTWNAAAGTNTAASYTTDASAADGTKFRCQVSGQCGPTVTSNVVTLSVNTAPTIDTQPPTTLSACTGQSPTIGVMASGFGTLAYLWEYSTDNGATWAPAPGTNSNASYTLQAVSSGDQGNLYRVTVSNTCGSNTSTTTSLELSGTVNLSLTVELQSVNPGTMTRCIAVSVFDGACTQTDFNVPLTFTSGIAGTTIPLSGCASVAAIQVRDPKHTLSRFALAGSSNLDVSNPNSVVATFTAATNKVLIGGNVNDDDFVDILDFGGYIGQIGGNVGANTACSLSTLHADFSGNGLVDTADFTYIVSNFLAPRDEGGCTSPVHGVPGQPGGPVTDVSVYELAASGQWNAARGDLDRNGRLNLEDAMFAARNGVATCVADFNGVGGVSVQDIFDFISAWMNGHPASDVNRDRSVGVQDLFDFLAAWFAGC